MLEPRTHEVKSKTEFFDEIVCGDNLTQVRKDDRNYQKGDTLHLREWVARTKRYTGREAKVEITHVIRDFKGIEKGYCVLSIRQKPGKIMELHIPKGRGRGK